MNLNKEKIVLIISCFVIVSSANLAEQEDYVYVLNSQNFDQFLVDNDFTVGKFKF